MEAAEQPEARVDPTNMARYHLAPGQDPAADVVTLVAASGGPGKAVDGEAWRSWEVVRGDG